MQGAQPSEAARSPAQRTAQHSALTLRADLQLQRGVAADLPSLTLSPTPILAVHAAIQAHADSLGANAAGRSTQGGGGGTASW
jgi:hypothetical protein